MKSVGLLWGALGLGAMVGCSASASTADQDGRSAQSQVVEPEWAKDNSPAPEFAVAMKIQPIPDSADEADSASPTPSVKPIPEEEGETPIRLRHAQRALQTH